MIVFDQELRQFSVVDETREFGGVIRNRYGALQWGHQDHGLKGIIRSAQGKDDQSLRNKNDKRAHKERMAMIKMGMDPSKIESQTVTQDRMRYDDRADKRSNKTSRYEAKQSARAAKLKAEMADRADIRDTRVELDKLAYEDKAGKRSDKIARLEARQDARAARLQARMADRADKRDYKLNLAPEKTKQLAVKKLG